MRCHKTECFGIVDGMTARQINAINVVEQFLPAPSSKGISLVVIVHGDAGNRHGDEVCLASPIVKPENSQSRLVGS